MADSTFDSGVRPAGSPEVAAGGGTEPEPQETPAGTPTPHPGDGVDLKTEDLPDPDA